MKNSVALGFFGAFVAIVTTAAQVRVDDAR